MATPYEKETVEFLAKTKAKALAVLLIEGDRGSNFEIRCVSEKYMRLMPKALIEMASRIEGEINAKDMELKKKIAETKETLEIIEGGPKIKVGMKKK